MRAAIAFLTIVGRGAAPDPRALVWFPVVGVAIGAGLGLAWTAADELWAPALVAALVVAADLAVTGLLHLDGLADSADGLLPHLDRDRRLAVMAAPDTGAFAVGVVGATLLVRFAALATGEPAVAVPAALWCASRTLMAVTVSAVPYARREGLAGGFRGARAAPVLAAGTAIVATLAVTDPLRIAASVGAALVAGATVVAFARRRLGGYTGDVLGAAGVVAETAGLVVAAARW